MKMKAPLIVLCALLLVVASVMGTLAFLTSTTNAVVNTFTYGNVTITLDEAKVDEYGVEDTEAARVTKNQYKLIPGHTYVKDPTIHVDENSEDCYLFAKIDNGLGTNGTITVSNGWSKIEGTENIYMYANKVSANAEVEIFAQFTFANDANPADYENANITVTGYAVQADGMQGPADAWAKAPCTAWTTPAA